MHTTLRRTLGAVFTMFFAFTLPSRAEFTFNKGEHISLIGNSLASRMQYDGWLETLLQSSQQGKELVFRNLSYPGDQVKKRPRNSGHMSPEDYFKLCKTDVIFVFFGYNESFNGPGGVSTYEKDLASMIDNYRKLKPNGESEPRFVLFSPIAHENLRSRNLPDGSENNARLKLYAEATGKVARDKNVTFVDLFNKSQALYDRAENPQTINGVHLNSEGNRKIAQIIVAELTGSRVKGARKLESLRQAVLDKNFHWFNRHRATDGNDVWGGRSGLRFVRDQTNREVLQHELIMLDVMTANRDPRIWAQSQGNDLTISDSNVPAPISVTSNVGGGSKSSSAAKEGSTEYLDGQEAISKMKVRDGFEINLFADEKQFPELVNPVQMTVGPEGRLWVAAWKTYPKWEPLKKMDDRILILPDNDRDGVADKAITFAKVHNPTAIEFWNGGVLVASQPNIIFLKDTDGDDKADFEMVYLEGIGSADTHHAANAFVYGPDGGLYWQSGIFLVNHIEHPWGPALNTGNSGMFRFDPRQYQITFHAGNSPNPHGISFDHWGYHYATDGTGGRAYQVRPEGRGFKMHELLKKEVRPVPANGVVSSTQFPENMQGDFLILNTIGFLGIKQYKLNRDPDTGKVWGEPLGDLLSSTDKNFRPSDAEFGEDGALYISDWHNIIIGHMQHNVRDPNRDHKHGRIYRMTAKGRPLQKPVEIAGAPLSQLMSNLEHPVDGIRYRTRLELSGRDTREVIAACRKWLKQFDPQKKEDAHHLLEGLWVHQQHNMRNPELLTALMKSPEPHARNAAATVQHHWYNVDTKAVVVKKDDLEQPATKSGILHETDTLVEVRIGTVIEKMKYDTPEFTVKAGKNIKLTFVNSDFIPHNILFVQPRSGTEVAMAALRLGAAGFTKGFIPASNKIIIASKLLDKDQEQVLEFTAPSKPGTYEYVCTFPGHHLLMRGKMIVK